MNTAYPRFSSKEEYNKKYEPNNENLIMVTEILQVKDTMDPAVRPTDRIITFVNDSKYRRDIPIYVEIVVDGYDPTQSIPNERKSQCASQCASQYASQCASLEPRNKKQKIG